MEEFICLKDWKVGNTYYFTKGKTYKGKRNKDGSVEMIGNASFINITFYVGTAYFDIENDPLPVQKEQGSKSRDIFLYPGEINIFTRWMSSNDRDELLKKARDIRTDLLSFASKLDEDIKGVHMKFYELDADDFGMNGEVDDVSKYMITFDFLEKEEFTEEWSED